MWKRLHRFYVRWFETCMLFLTRHAPKSLHHANDEPFTVLWEAATIHHCPFCVWVFMIWDEDEQLWLCTRCAARTHPQLSVTEKRPAIALPAPKVTISLRRTGDLARAYHEHKDIIPVPVDNALLCRLGTKDGRTITTEELKAYPGFRRTG